MSAEDAAPIVCPDCGHENPPSNRFCGGCGAKVVAPPPAPSALDAEPAAPPPADVESARVVTAPKVSPGSNAFTATELRRREAELQRLLTRANVERMRALIVQAKKTLDEAEALASELGEKAVAQVMEQRGDMLAMEERWAAARDCFDAARKGDPTRALAEKKYAEMAVRLADEEALTRLGGAVLRGDSIGEILSDPRSGKRNAGAAMLASSMVPGLGQILAGQFTKGAICMGVWIVCFAWIGLSPDHSALVDTITGLFNPKLGKLHKEISTVTWMAVVGMVVTWIYSVFEAPLSAGKTVALEGSANVGDKSGWEP